MSTIKVQNYIHTLFTVEFQLPWRVSNTVRTLLQSNYQYLELMFEWMETKIYQTTIPKWRKNLRNWLLFENREDMQKMRDWTEGDDPDGFDKPDVKYLEFRTAGLTTVLDVNFYFRGLQYELFGRTLVYPPVFYEFKNLGPSKAHLNKTDLTKSEFYSRIEYLLDKLTSANKIPFELYNIK